MAAADEYILVAPPGDGVSNLTFSPSPSNLLLVSSWDSSDDVGYAGGLDQMVHSLDLHRGSSKAVLAHEGAVSCMQWSTSTHALISGSWDGSMSLHDPRAQQPAARSPLPGKAYSLSSAGNKVVVATADRQILVFDLRNLQGGAQEVRESPLKYQTRRVSCFLDGSAFAVGSVEGRVAVEYLSHPEPERPAERRAGYTFKCHRRGELAFPVNDIAFHPVYGTFATGGCDGTVSCWDGFSKKRLCQLRQYPTSISSLSFSHDGSLLAIASSYTHEEGDKPAPDDNIFIRTVQDAEVRPKKMPVTST